MPNFAPQKGMSEKEIDQTVNAVLAEATLEEKVAMMSGHGFFEQFKENGMWGGNPYRAGGGCKRLGVPAFYFTDGPRGVARGNSTCFPCTMARGATFDVDLERRIGEVMGTEARAQDCNLSGAVCVNLLRHPAWGRAQETYGEDPYHLGEMGAALATGIQTHNVVATVKHYALNSIENARFKVDVQIDERSLHEIYLPHFKRILDAGCASVMSAYNKMNGEFCGQNRYLLTDILRGDWGFDGFVHSDWVMGVRNPYGAAAGLDVENPEPIHFGEKLVNAVEQGSIEPQVIDQACRRILTTLYRFMGAEDPLEAYTSDLVASGSHRAIAQEAALKSPVLLKNDNVLPLAKADIKKLAVLGTLADCENTGDNGSSRVRPPYIVTPLKGLSAYLGDQVEIVQGDELDAAAAADVAARCDAAVVIVGYTAREEGEFIPGDMTLGQEDTPTELENVAAAITEDHGFGVSTPNAPIGGDRDTLRLPDPHVTLINAVSSRNAKTIVVVVAGSAVVMAEWIDGVAAVLQTFYSGMEGGTALAKLLFGDESPSGKLPFSVPHTEDDLPFFDKDADAISYDQWHGYTLFDESGREVAFPFGFGLSYTQFKHRALRVRRAKDSVETQISVSNEGNRAADEVVQLYFGFPGTEARRPKKLLKGFQRVRLRPGETQTLRFSTPFEDLCWYDPNTRSWRLETGEHRVYAGNSARDSDLIQQSIEL